MEANMEREWGKVVRGSYKVKMEVKVEREGG